MKLYPKIISNYNAKITIVDRETQNTNSDIGGYCFQSEDTKERVWVDYNRIAFADKNKYESFDVFLINLKKHLRLFKRIDL
jgi:hypothetical protein